MSVLQLPEVKIPYRDQESRATQRERLSRAADGGTQVGSDPGPACRLRQRQLARSLPWDGDTETEDHGCTPLQVSCSKGFVETTPLSPPSRSKPAFEVDHASPDADAHLRNTQLPL